MIYTKINNKDYKDYIYKMSVQYSPEAMKVFKRDCINFINDLIEVVPKEKDLVMARWLLENSIPIRTVLDTFIERVFPLKQKIKVRDDNFFLQENSMFGGVNDDKVVHFKKIWQSDNLTDEDREIIWKWVDRLVKDADNCIRHEKN